MRHNLCNLPFFPSLSCDLSPLHPFLSKNRYKELKEQREAKSHDVELIHTRINQSTHHQQLVQIQALKDAIGGCGQWGVREYSLIAVRDHSYV